MNVAEKTWNGIVNFFKDLGHTLTPEAEQALKDFETKVTPDSLKLMGDAVEYAASFGVGGDTARSTAIQKFITDGKATIVDIETWARSDYNLLLELVYKTTAAKITAATAQSSNIPPTDTHTINSPGTSI